MHEGCPHALPEPGSASRILRVPTPPAASPACSLTPPLLSGDSKTKVNFEDAGLSIGWQKNHSAGLLSSLTSRTHIHCIKGAGGLTLRQKGLGPPIPELPSWKKPLLESEQLRNVKISSADSHRARVSRLPRLTHFSVAHLPQPPQAHACCQTLTETVPRTARSSLSTLPPPDQERRSYGK